MAALEQFAARATDERVARVLAGELNDDADIYLRLVRRLVGLAEPDASNRLVMHFREALFGEVCRRTVARTTREGATILRWDATDGSTVTDGDVDQLIHAGLRRRRYSDWEDAKAMYRAALVALVAEHQADSHWRQLHRIVSGGLNDIPRLADNRVREQVRQRQRQLAVEIPHGGSADLEDLAAQVEQTRERSNARSSKSRCRPI